MPRRVHTAKIGVDGRSEYWSKWHNSLSDAIDSLDKKMQEEAHQTEERDRKDREAHMKAEIAMLVYQVKKKSITPRRPAAPKATKQTTGRRPCQKSQAKEYGYLTWVDGMAKIEKTRRKQEMDRLAAAERESKRSAEAERIRKQEEAARLDALYHLSQTIVGDDDNDAIDEEAEQEIFDSLVRIHSKVKEAEELERSHSQVEKDAETQVVIANDEQGGEATTKQGPEVG